MKYVITGGACCGKTTLINKLEKKGFKVIHESAREILEERNFINKEDLEIKIFELQIEKEKELEGFSGKVFLDRGILDCCVYSHHNLGYIPDKIRNFLDLNFVHNYNKIFVLDLLDFEKDGIRVEKNYFEIEEIHNKLIEIYERYFEVVRVPKMPVEERVSLVLKNLD